MNVTLVLRGKFRFNESRSGRFNGSENKQENGYENTITIYRSNIFHAFEADTTQPRRIALSYKIS